MNRETPMLYADQMQFIVAAMTKDYDKAIAIANMILKAEPGNTILRNYLSVLEREANKRKQIHDDVDVSESDSEPHSVDSNSDNTDSNSDKSSDSNRSSQNTEENEKERKNSCRRFDTKYLVFDSGEAKTSHDPNCRHNHIETNEAKFRYNEVKGKMIRVLPIRLSENISGLK